MRPLCYDYQGKKHTRTQTQGVERKKGLEETESERGEKKGREKKRKGKERKKERKTKLRALMSPPRFFSQESL